MRVVAASYYDEIFVPIVRDICERLGWTVCDWISAYASPDPANRPEVAFPNASVHLPHLAARGILPANLQSKRLPQLDAEILGRMAPYEGMFMRMLDIYDPDGHSFSGRERRTAYYDSLRAALHVVQEHQPGLFIAGTIPHSLHDYMLYAVCKAHGIPTFIYVAFALPGYLLLNSSLEDANVRLGAEYRGILSRFDGKATALPPDLEAYLTAVRRDYSVGEPWYARLRDHSMLARQPASLRLSLETWQRLKLNLAFAASYLRSPRRRHEEHFVRPIADVIKMRGVSLRDTITTQHAAARIFSRGVRIKKRLLAQYRAMEKAPDYEENYVFVPLHYQPEASTSPLGGVFLDQILMIKLLADCLPTGWKIYVKEHRTTFDPSLRGHFARDLAYYQEIRETPAVQLVPMEIPSFELIDRAKAVATVTGTAGWEGVVRGVPALVFGNAWYKDCEGVFDARRREDCLAAFDRIRHGFRPDFERVRLFLHAVARVGLRADRDNSYVLTDLTPAQSRAATVEHFLREYSLMTARGG